MINKENYKDKLFEFAGEKYGPKLSSFYERFFDEFPYNYEGLDRELHFKNFIDWLMIEKPLPETGKTIVEEFIEEHPDLPAEIEQGMHRMKNVVKGKFKVIYILGKDLMIRTLGSGKEYQIQLYNEHNHLEKGDLMIGRIHEFDEKYRFCGAFLIEKQNPLPKLPSFFLRPEELMERWNHGSIKDIENKIIFENQKLTALLGNFPFQWVDGICNIFSIEASKKREKIKLIGEKINNNLPIILEGLNDKSKEVLQVILKEGGFVKYNRLKDYDDEINFWWNEKGVPTSTIGALRARGLLFIGKMPLGRMYKAALIPKEIRKPLWDLLFEK